MQGSVPYQHLIAPHTNQSFNGQSAANTVKTDATSTATARVVASASFSSALASLLPQ